MFDIMSRREEELNEVEDQPEILHINLRTVKIIKFSFYICYCGFILRILRVSFALVLIRISNENLLNFVTVLYTLIQIPSTYCSASRSTYNTPAFFKS